MSSSLVRPSRRLAMREVEQLFSSGSDALELCQFKSLFKENGRLPVA